MLPRRSMEGDMEKDQKLEFLRKVPLFAGCTKTNLSRISRLVDEIELPAGRVLMQQGRVGSEFFVIVNGTVEVFRDGRQIDSLGPGDFLGEISLIDHRPRTATAVCKTDCTFLVLAHREFHSLLEESPGIAQAVMRSLAERLRALEPQRAH
jgi:CRP/FNR family transcriptional regulator, cyclic AMP receptor protein